MRAGGASSDARLPPGNGTPIPQDVPGSVGTLDDSAMPSRNTETPAPLGAGVVV